MDPLKRPELLEGCLYCLQASRSPSSPQCMIPRCGSVQIIAILEHIWSPLRRNTSRSGYLVGFHQNKMLNLTSTFEFLSRDFLGTGSSLALDIFPLLCNMKTKCHARMMRKASSG